MVNFRMLVITHSSVLLDAVLRWKLSKVPKFDQVDGWSGSTRKFASKISVIIKRCVDVKINILIYKHLCGSSPEKLKDFRSILLSRITGGGKSS